MSDALAQRAAARPAASSRRAGVWISLVVLAAVIILSFTVGKFAVAPGDLIAVVFAKLTGTAAGVDPVTETVVWKIRLPRVLAGLFVGAALATAGATYQGMLRNPLVSPDILGVSAGASLGAILGIFLSLPIVAIQLLAFAGGLAAVAVVYGLGARIRTHDPILVLVLAGIALGTLLAAAISLLKVLADPYNQLPTITYWLLGSLATITGDDLTTVAPVIALGLIPLYLLRWKINLLTLGEDEARTLGVETRVLRAILIAVATWMTAAAVSISGIIGWIGLLIPHIARLLVGPDFSRLLPASLMLGGGYLVLVDMLARTIAPLEVPLGIVTAFLGAPFFLWLLANTRGGWQ
jgi:iron complex transport system permease protein